MYYTISNFSRKITRIFKKSGVKKIEKLTC